MAGIQVVSGKSTVATYYRAYLLDLAGYRTIAIPIVRRLEAGDHDELQAQATDLAAKTPGIWALLDDYRLYPDDLGREAEAFDSVEGRVYFWMMIVLVAYCRPIGVPAHYGQSIHEAVGRFVQDEAALLRLAQGKPLCALLHPELVPNEAIARRWDDRWPFWCRFGTKGWLDEYDARELLQLLLRLNRFFAHSSAESPPRVPARQREAYQAALDILGAAAQPGRGLLLSIVD